MTKKEKAKKFYKYMMLNSEIDKNITIVENIFDRGNKDLDRYADDFINALKEFPFFYTQDDIDRESTLTVKSYFFKREYWQHEPSDNDLLEIKFLTVEQFKSKFFGRQLEFVF